jgi:folate-binding protein YgfZ
MNQAFQQEYDALTRGAGWVDFAGRTQIEISGPDRQSFLHNLCTNDIRRLRPGEGCEAFITNVQGKVLGLVYVFCGDESLVLDTVPGQAEVLLSHFEKYHIRENVELRDRSGDWTEMLVHAEQRRTPSGRPFAGHLPSEHCDHCTIPWDDINLSVRRVDMVGVDCFLISFAATAREHFVAGLAESTFIPCGCDAFAAARIEHGTPLYGIDISDKNLPQEVNRNERAISFTKGCYLGQETVARIDALGHVNQTLCGVKFDAATLPPPGLELTSSGKPVGRVTSSAFSPRLSCPLGLAYIRRGHNEPGTKLTCELGEAEVVALPAK